LDRVKSSWLNSTSQYDGTVANEGYYYTPHIIKKIKGTAIDPKFKVKHQTDKKGVFQTDD
jgi:cell division protein FtsI/penicillin-binding protein 2